MAGRGLAHVAERVDDVARAAWLGRCTGRPVPSREAVLAALAHLGEYRRRGEQVELELVMCARAQQISWSAIAAALGYRARQSAQSRATRLGMGRVTS